MGLVSCRSQALVPDRDFQLVSRFSPTSRWMFFRRNFVCPCGKPYLLSSQALGCVRGVSTHSGVSMRPNPGLPLNGWYRDQPGL